MTGTGLKCMKCGRIFRRIHGGTSEEVQQGLSKEQKEKFFGDDFSCCGEEYLKSLHELGMMGELLKLQQEWVIAMANKN